MHEDEAILLVEDNFRDARTIRSAFQGAGLSGRFIIAHDGEQAMDYLAGKEPYSDRSDFPMPRLLLLDLNAPKTGGLALLAWVRCQAFGKNLPVIMLTESAYNAEIHKAYELEALGFLFKPFEPNEFMSALKKATEFWFQGVELPAVLPFVPRPARDNEEIVLCPQA